MFNVVKQFFSKHVLNVHPTFHTSSMCFCKAQCDLVDWVRQLVSYWLQDFLQSISVLNVGELLTEKNNVASCDSLAFLSSEPVEGAPASPGRGLTYAQGPHVTYEIFFSSFLMFSKYLWRYSCIMKSTRELEAPRQARSQGWGCDGWVSTPSHAKMVRLVEYRYTVPNYVM